MKQIKIPGILIKKLVKKYNNQNIAPKNKRVRNFLEGESKKNSNLNKISKKILKENSFKNLTPADIGWGIVACIDLLFQPRRRDNKIAIHYYADRYLVNTETVWLDYCFKTPIKEILKKTSLHDDVINIISMFLIYLEDEYSKNRYEFRLGIEPEILDKNKLNIDNRIEIKADKNLTFKGVYKGSPMIINQNIFIDLSVILSLLEMESVISSSNIFIAGKNPKIYLEFTFPNNSNLTLEYLKKGFIEHTEKLKVGRIFHIPLDFFNLASEKMDGSKLRSVLGFFDSENYRMESFSFLKYWFAIEFMLESSKKSTWKSIEKNYKNLFPKEEIKEIKDFWKIRCKMVHQGEQYIDHHTIWKIENKAKKIFYKLLSQEIEEKMETKSHNQKIVPKYKIGFKLLLKKFFQDSKYSK